MEELQSNNIDHPQFNGIDYIAYQGIEEVTMRHDNELIMVFGSFDGVSIINSHSSMRVTFIWKPPWDLDMSLLHEYNDPFMWEEHDGSMSFNFSKPHRGHWT